MPRRKKKEAEIENVAKTTFDIFRDSIFHGRSENILKINYLELFSIYYYYYFYLFLYNSLPLIDLSFIPA